jgi:hypothetical protein
MGSRMWRRTSESEGRREGGQDGEEASEYLGGAAKRKQNQDLKPFVLEWRAEQAERAGTCDE